MSLRKIGLAVLAALLLLLIGEDYFRTWLRDAGKPPGNELDALRATQQDLAGRVAGLRDLTGAQRAPASVLDLVSLALPDRVWLERLSLREKSVTIAGRAADTLAIADFLESLGEIRGFEEPETRSITASGGGYRFSLGFLIDPAALMTAASDGDPSPERAARSGRPDLSTEALRQNIGELESQLDRLLPDTRQTDDLLRHIRTLARQTDVALLRFRPQEIIDGDFHSRWPIDVSVEAPYHGLVSFLDQVGGIGRLVIPGDLDVVATQGGSRITATLVLTTYLKTQNESDAPPD